MRGIDFSGFGDEAAAGIEEQMRVLKNNGIQYIELRGVDGGHVLDLDDVGLAALKEKLDEGGFKVSAIGSPVGKSPIGEDFGAARELLLKAINAAKLLGCGYIRGFSFYIPEGEAPDAYGGEVVRRLKELVGLCEANGLVYALENESGVFADVTERCEYVIERVGSDSLKLAFDPGNFVRNGVRPYPDAYERLKKHIAYFHIKDAKIGGDQFVPCGEGDGEMARLLNAAYASGFAGFLSVEPHLSYMEGLTDEQRFGIACDALKKTLREAGIAEER